MQFAAYLIVREEKIKVLVRETRTYRALKIRKTGKDGSFLEDESIYLSEPTSISELKLLKNGRVIKC